MDFKTCHAFFQLKTGRTANRASISDVVKLHFATLYSRKSYQRGNQNKINISIFYFHRLNASDVYLKIIVLPLKNLIHSGVYSQNKLLGQLLCLSNCYIPFLLCKKHFLSSSIITGLPLRVVQKSYCWKDSILYSQQHFLWTTTTTTYKILFVI